MSLLGPKGEETYEEKKERYRKKQAMVLTPEQNKRANKNGLIFYLLTYLYVIFNSVLHGEIKIVPFAVMAVMAVVQIYLYAKKGNLDQTATTMSLAFVVTYFVNVLTLESEFYPMIFIVVYALVIFSDVLLCKCGAIATLVGVILRAIVLVIKGTSIMSLLPMLILTGIFTYAVIVTAKAIYESSYENMETIEAATKEALGVAEKIEVISNEIIDNFSDITGGMKVITEKAGENKEALNDITSASVDNSEQMHHQTDMTQNIYAVVEETQANAAHVQENALTVLETVEQGAELSQEMIVHTKAVTDGINETQDVVKELVEHVGEVSGITDSILAISSQTNLLALNASIEAARAGEAGKGFAVVADEIRNLAEQTKNSTEEISNIMNTLVAYATTSVKTLDRCVEDVESQTTVINQVSESFTSTVDDVANLKLLVDGIIASIEEISKHTATIVDSVSNVNENTQKVSELSGSGAEGASVIYDIIQNFATTIGELNKRVNELQEVTRK